MTTSLIAMALAVGVAFLITGFIQSMLRASFTHAVQGAVDVAAFPKNGVRLVDVVLMANAQGRTVDESAELPFYVVTDRGIRVVTGAIIATYNSGKALILDLEDLNAHKAE